MSKTTELAVIEFGPMDLRTLEEVSTQLGACRLASEQKTGPKQSAGAQILSVFLRAVDEKLASFVKDLRERMKAKATTT
jgi:hypothetical protein